MNKFFKLALMPLAAALVLVGCGGSGGGFSLTRAVGSFGGGFQSNDGSDSGNLTLNIDGSGNATGTITNDADSRTGTVTGTVDAGGNYNLNVDYNQGTDSTISGNFDFGSNSSLHSNYTELEGSSSTSGSFTLVKGVNGGGSGSNSFAGTYTSSISLTGQVNTMDVFLAIGSNGDISGSIDNNILNFHGVVTGHVNDSNGSFTLTIDYGNNQSVTWTGTLTSSGSGFTGTFNQTGSLGTLSGTFTFSHT